MVDRLKKAKDSVKKLADTAPKRVRSYASAGKKKATTFREHVRTHRLVWMDMRVPSAKQESFRVGNDVYTTIPPQTLHGARIAIWKAFVEQVSRA
jgi:hypothetical protein